MTYTYSKARKKYFFKEHFQIASLFIVLFISLALKKNIRRQIKTQEQLLYINQTFKKC